jgi:hypothetical protein
LTPDEIAYPVKKAQYPIAKRIVVSTLTSNRLYGLNAESTKEEQNVTPKKI